MIEKREWSHEWVSVPDDAITKITLLPGEVVTVWVGNNNLQNKPPSCDDWEAETIQ